MSVVRFAPSPTGHIHIGNLRTALFNWFVARKTNGTFVLRFDDTDQERSSSEFASGIESDLRWAGIQPDRIEFQSRRTNLYLAARDRLIASGRLYPCYETPDELDRKRARARALGRPGIYDRAALNLTETDRAKLEADGRTAHWRFRLSGDAIIFEDYIRGPQTVHTDSMSDPVLIRADGSFLYTLPSVVDDIDMGITDIIRGEDHVSNTGVQLELFDALGGVRPGFAHHNLLTDGEGQGLSKRLKSLSISQLREDGFEPLAVDILASVTGTSYSVEPVASLEILIERFEFDQISRAPARFGMGELETLNARLLHEMDFAKAAARSDLPDGMDETVWNALRPNLEKFSDINGLWKIVKGPIQPVVAPEDRAFIDAAREALPDDPWDDDVWRAWTATLKGATGRKGRDLFHPLRLALTGQESGPELKALMPLIGRKGCLDRLA